MLGKVRGGEGRVTRVYRQGRGGKAGMQVKREGGCCATPPPPPTHTQTCSRWPIEQHAPGWLYVEPLKELRVEEGQEDHLFEGADVVVQATHLLKADGHVHLHTDHVPGGRGRAAAAVW